MYTKPCYILPDYSEEEKYSWYSWYTQEAETTIYTDYEIRAYSPQAKSDC